MTEKTTILVGQTDVVDIYGPQKEAGKRSAGRYNTLGAIKFQPRVTAGRFRAIAKAVSEVMVEQFEAVLATGVLPLDWREVMQQCVQSGYGELGQIFVVPKDVLEDGTKIWKIGVSRYVDLLWAWPQLKLHYAEVRVQRALEEQA